MIRTLTLFAHLIGVVTLFGALAVEFVGLESLRRIATRAEASPWLRVLAKLPRMHGIALGITLLSGIYLAMRVGVGGFAWVRLSLLTMVLIGIAGGPMIRSRMRILTSDDDAASLRSRASDTLLRVSIRTRIALSLAVVFVMIAKAGLATCLTAIGAALFVAIVSSLFSPSPKLSGA